MYSTNTDRVVPCSTHISHRMIGSRNGLVMAIRTHLRKGETWGNLFIVTVAPSVRLANEGRQKSGQTPFRLYRLISSIGGMRFTMVLIGLFNDLGSFLGGNIPTLPICQEIQLASPQFWICLKLRRLSTKLGM